MCEDIAAERPSIYMLVGMVRTLRRREFLSVAAVLEALANARRVARRRERVLSERLERDIRRAEKQLP